MRAVVWLGKGKLKVITRKVPEHLLGTSIIALRAAGICATDREVTDGRIVGVKSGVVLGHEIAGIVVAGGDDKIFVGNRVVVDTVDPCEECDSCTQNPPGECQSPGELGFTADGGWAQYVRVKTSRLHLIPENLSWKEAVLSEPFVIPFGALLDSEEIIKDKNVLVVGGGIAAIAFTAGLVALGAKHVDVSLRSNRRAKLFNEISVKVSSVIAEELKLANADLSIDAVGNSKSIKNAIAGVKFRGMVICYGFTDELIDAFPIAEIVLRNLRLSGHTNSSNKWPLVLDLMKSGEIKTSGLVDRVITLDQVPDAVLNWGENLRTVIRFLDEDLI